MVRCKGKILLAIVLAIVISAYGRAYGEIIPGDYSPVVAYNSLNNSYLVLYFKFEYDTQSSVRGQLINPYGISYGPEFVVSITASYNPSIAYDSVNQRYMVVWNDIRSNYWDIWGHLLNPDGTLNGKEFFISINPSSQEGPSIAYDSATQRFLVAWADDRNSGRTDWDIYGQLVNSDGTLNGPDFFICNAPNGQSHPVVSYDSVNKRFLVAWMDYRGGSSWDIYGQFVNPDGTRAGTNFVISDTPSQQYSPGNIPSLAYDSINQKFLVVWQDIRSGTSYGTYGHVYGQLVNWDGTLNGVNFVISNAPESQLYPSIAYDNAKQRFLVVWQDNRGGSSWDIYGQLVNPDGNLDGGNFVISDAPYTKVNPSVAYNPRCGNFLVAFQTLETPPYGIGFAIAGPPCQLSVAIDIEPWFKPNIVNRNFKWAPIPVAILSKPGFDAPKMIDRASLTFGGNGDENSLAFCSPLAIDVNGDKARDLVCFFYTGKADFQCGDTEGILKGKTKDGTPIEGRDSVKIAPCK
jgi:hypothetical protein